MEGSKNHLGVNKIGKSIRKSPLHPSSSSNSRPPQQTAAAPPPPPPQPQVYNISKNDFRSIVQQLTGTPTRDPINPNSPNPVPSSSSSSSGHYPHRPPPPKPPSQRLQKIRPPPLTPIARLAPSALPPPLHFPLQQNPIPGPNAPFVPRPSIHPPWAPPAESPVTAYMRYLESSILNTHTPGAAFPSPRSNFPLAGSPRPPLPPLLPSPGLPSPSSFLNVLSPRSPYAPLLSPGLQYPPPFMPNFSFSPLGQSGLLGPAPGMQPPLSPGLLFPPSPSGFFPMTSPRWRDM